MTSDALARRSVAMTVAPESRATPFTMAVLPRTSMSRPCRTSSGTCMKRFSKMVSVMTAVPSRGQHERHELRLHVGRKARVRRGRHVDATERAGA